MVTATGCIEVGWTVGERIGELKDTGAMFVAGPIGCPTSARIVVVEGGTNGYWWFGTTGVFTTDRTGKLWFGFNDDAVSGRIDDDSGAVFGEVTITH